MCRPSKKRSKNEKRLLRIFRWQALIQQKFRCFWCQQPLVDLRHLPGLATSRRVNESHVRFFDGKKWHVRLIATADHLVPRADGGPATSVNIVAACQPCNQARSLPNRDAA